jgi:hypothetical protein
MIHFYDAASPENVPSGVYAAVYVNGYAWPQDQIDRMSRVIRVSVERDALWARHARVLDIENGAGEPEDLVPFIQERRRLGFRDATGYVNRSNWDDCKERVSFAKLPCLWWVSTLDGTQDVPGAWAVQYYGGMHSPYDMSVILGENNFREHSAR